MSVTVERFAVRWRLPGPEHAERAGRALDAVTGGPLERALDAVTGPDELVALRSVAVTGVVVPAADAPEATARAAAVWAERVAVAVRDTLRRGGPGVVRYANRHAAVLDVLRRTAAGDPDRIWAWRALGLWPDGHAGSGGAAGSPAADAADVVTALLLDTPGAVPALLASCRGTAVPVLLGVDRMDALARAVWSARGTPTTPADGRTVAPAALVDAVAARAAVVRHPAPAGAAAGRWYRALALLAVAEVEPGLVGTADGVTLAGALAARLADRTPAGLDGADGTGDAAGPALRPTVADVPDAADAAIGPRVRPAPDGDADTAGAAAVEDTRDAGAAGRFGGLLFLLHVLGPVATDPGGAARRHGLRPLLHRIGGTLLRRAGLVPVSTDTSLLTDPALLAVAGLPPAADAPECPTDAGDAAEAAADDVERALRARLRGRPLADAARPALLAHVLHRRVWITADPGWIDAALDLSEVDVDLRAAGLDLDPGHLPWLGCVVRFRYREAGGDV